MSKLLTRQEAEEYLLKYVIEGYKGMLESITDDELTTLFLNTTGQQLVLPVGQDGRVTDVQGNTISNGGQDSELSLGTDEEDAGSVAADDK